MTVTASTLVLAFLLSINPYPTTETSVLTFAAPPIEMTIEKCLADALEINKDKESPYVMVCAPILPKADASI